jgi:hypothetical protein
MSLKLAFGAKFSHVAASNREFERGTLEHDQLHFLVNKIDIQREACEDVNA